MTVTRRRGSPGNRVENLSFFDVYRYCYLSQSEIDRSVVRHDDTILERRRKATFEMLFGLSDVETAAAERIVAELTAELATARQEEASVRRFLEQAGEQSEVELQLERERLQNVVQQANGELAELRADMRAVTSDEAGRQRQVAQLAHQVQVVNQQAVVLQAQLRKHATGIAQYELQLEQLSRRDSARQLLDRIEFSRCPRCMQSVMDRSVEVGTCLLCTQPEQEQRTVGDFLHGSPDGQLGFGALAVNDERQRIETLRDDVASLAQEDQSDLDAILGGQRALELALREMLTELDRRTEEYISPRFEAISELSARSAGAEARLVAIDRALAYWTKFRELTARVTALEVRLVTARSAADEAFSALEARRTIVTELSDAFDDQVRRLEPPWYQGARIDLKTYLPVLNGSAFESLSGGEKTMVNVAYHLALLTVALARRDTYLPALLVLDTPRKNLGAGYDQTYANRIYRQVVALADAYRGRFQLVIADNDPPLLPIADSEAIDLDYDHPLIPGVEHPGEGVEPVAGGEETDS
jgi:small-conductance mechanosensitive channel